MKILLLVSCLFLLTTTSKNCRDKKTTYPVGCYKGKLVIKAACMNYTIRLIGGNMDTALRSSSWTDENTGITHQNVFALGSHCTFPGTIEEGAEFYFTIDSTPQQNCAVCMSYYPVPPKKLSIKVLTIPCAQP